MQDIFSMKNILINTLKSSNEDMFFSSSFKDPIKQIKMMGEANKQQKEYVEKISREKNKSLIFMKENKVC